MLFTFPGCGVWIVYLLIVLLSTNFYFCVRLTSGLLVLCVCLFVCWIVHLVFLFGFVCFLLVVWVLALYVGGFWHWFVLWFAFKVVWLYLWVLVWFGLVGY